jgi:hypothetical protein
MTTETLIAYLAYCTTATIGIMAINSKLYISRKYLKRYKL